MDWSAAHSGFVAASYAVSGIVLAALIVSILRKKRKLEAMLDDTGTNQGDKR